MTDGPEIAPYTLLGDSEEERRARAITLAERFYDIMEEREPALRDTHRLDPEGHVTRDSRDRFGLFLVGWLGGPQEYMEQHGHPRLRMRHREVPIDTELAVAWVRTMIAAMEDVGINGELRAFLEERFAHVAGFLRNTPD